MLVGVGSSDEDERVEETTEGDAEEGTKGKETDLLCSFSRDGVAKEDTKDGRGSDDNPLERGGCISFDEEAEGEGHDSAEHEDESDEEKGVLDELLAVEAEEDTEDAEEDHEDGLVVVDELPDPNVHQSRKDHAFPRVWLP